MAHTCARKGRLLASSLLWITQNRLFSAEKKDTLRSVVGQLKYSGGNESNTHDEYFFLTKTRHGLAVGAASQKVKVVSM